MSGLFGRSPEVPDREQISEQEKKKIRSGSSKSTILTGPLGLMGTPQTEKKILLGE